MPHDVFEHQATKVELPLHSNLENEGSKVVCDYRSVCSWKPVGPGYFMENGVLCREVGRLEVVLERVIPQLSSNDDRDY